MRQIHWQIGIGYGNTIEVPSEATNEEIDQAVKDDMWAMFGPTWSDLEEFLRMNNLENK